MPWEAPLARVSSNSSAPQADRPAVFFFVTHETDVDGRATGATLARPNRAFNAMQSTHQGDLPLTTIRILHGVEYHLDANNPTGPVSLQMSPCRRDHPHFWSRIERAAWFIAITGYEPTKVEIIEQRNGWYHLVSEVRKSGQKALVRRQQVTGEAIPS